MRDRLQVAAFVGLLAYLSYSWFPGHTFLGSDTMIYVPILDRLWDPSLLPDDPIATRPHVGYTIYDEVLLGLRHVFGWEFLTSLTLLQILFRAAGVLGTYWAARSTSLARIPSMLVAALCALGATIAGPAVLITEYEPVPRGFAIPLLLLAIGALARDRLWLGSAAAAVALLFHPPSTAGFWLVYVILAVRQARYRIGLLAPVLAAGLLIVLSRLQVDAEPQPFFGRIEPWLEELMRLRASYNWVSMWIRNWGVHYLLLWLLSLAAFLRIRHIVPLALRAYSLGLPLIGLVMIPLSYGLLEGVKWTLLPQFQPARALLFVTTFTMLLTALAGAHALRRNRLEAGLWFFVPIALSAQPRFTDLLLPDLGNPVLLQRLALIAGLAAAAALARRWWVAALVAVAPFLLLPTVGQVQNYATPNLDRLRELSAWAQANTPREAMFVFPNAARSNDPSLFRVFAQRPVYVDWKGGGQLNFLHDFAREWWERWQQVMANGYQPGAEAQYTQWGIDFLVLPPTAAKPSAERVFVNSAFAVYRLPATTAAAR